MEQVIFKYLRAEPEDHYFLLVSNVPLQHGGGNILLDLCVCVFFFIY